MIITSLDNKKMKDLKKLNERKYRDEEQLFLVEGEHLVKEAYKSGLLAELIILEGTSFDLDVPTTYVSGNVMKQLTSLTTPTTVIGVCHKRETSSNLGNRIVMLDSIQDPGNLGTIIRSAIAFDVDTLVIGKGSVDLYNPKVLRATQGLIFHINIIEDDLLSLIPTLKKDNYQILGTSVIGGTELSNFAIPDKWTLIMGNEGHGMNQEITNLCDKFIYIKMNNVCESLNVSIACSIILYRLSMR
jgi:TrmH family RNA methyltransferase